MMSRASFLEVSAHVFGLCLKILRYFRSGWLRARFSSAAVGASHTPPTLPSARRRHFSVRGLHRHFWRRSTPTILLSWLGEAFFRLPRRRGIWFGVFARRAVLIG